MNQRPAVSQPEPSALKRLRVAASASSVSSASWGLVVGLLLLVLLPAPNEARRISKRSIIDSGCRGNYVPTFEQYFGRLELICEECYGLYREPSIRHRCSKDCYRNEIFRDCLQALMLEKHVDEVYKMVNTLAGR